MILEVLELGEGCEFSVDDVREEILRVYGDLLSNVAVWRGLSSLFRQGLVCKRMVRSRVGGGVKFYWTLYIPQEK